MAESLIRQFKGQAFVARHTRILKTGPEAFFNERIAVANAARLNFHAHLAIGCAEAPVDLQEECRDIVAAFLESDDP